MGSGLLNKQVGGELGISDTTVKAHPGRVRRKMKADSLAELVKDVIATGCGSGVQELKRPIQRRYVENVESRIFSGA